MNRFLFRRSAANQAATSNPNQDETKPIEVDPKKGKQTDQQQNPSPQYALSSDNGTPKRLTLNEAAPNNAAAKRVVTTPVTITVEATAVTTSTVAPDKVAPDTVASNAAASNTAAPKKVMPNQNRNYANHGQSLIRLNNVVKAYQTPVGEFVALRGIDLAIGRGEFVAVVGKSGSGKSTLINMITGIDRPTSGEIYIDDTPIHNLAEGPMAEWRGRNIGIIFQFFQLLPMLSCIENVMLPMDFCNMFKPSEREKRALHLLEQVDMVEHAYKLPSEVSGGQQQRVAIARALANDPPLLVADEPTGNLDSRTAEAVFQLFARMVDAGKTILMVTHDDEMAHQVRRTITIADGQIVQQDYHAQKTTPTGKAASEKGDGQTTVADPSAVSA